MQQIEGKIGAEARMDAGIRTRCDQYCPLQVCVVLARSNLPIQYTSVYTTFILVYIHFYTGV